MTDLVKRLRFGIALDEQGDVSWCNQEAMFKAADRIEKLEAALREVLSLGNWGANILARCIIFEALETTNDSLGEKDENT
jgi:hypothetical protein